MTMVAKGAMTTMEAEVVVVKEMIMVMEAIVTVTTTAMKMEDVDGAASAANAMAKAAVAVAVVVAAEVVIDTAVMAADTRSLAPKHRKLRSFKDHRSLLVKDKYHREPK
jgi:DUF1009 family protein